MATEQTTDEPDWLTPAERERRQRASAPTLRDLTAVAPTQAVNQDDSSVGDRLTRETIVSLGPPVIIHVPGLRAATTTQSYE